MSYLPFRAQLPEKPGQKVVGSKERKKIGAKIPDGCDRGRLLISLLHIDFLLLNCGECYGVI
jgi:hypothetical protein